MSIPRRKIYYCAFLQRDGWEHPRLVWFGDLVDPDKVDERLTEVAVEHMKNRLVGGWRDSIPFCIQWRIAELVQPDFEI